MSRQEAWIPSDGPGRILLAFGLTAVVAILLGIRWVVVAEAYGAVWSVVGLLLLLGGAAVPTRLGSGPRNPAAYRVTGLALVGWGGFWAFILQHPLGLVPSLAAATFFSITVACVLVMRRRPNLSPFPSPSISPSSRA